MNAPCGRSASISCPTRSSLPRAASPHREPLRQRGWRPDAHRQRHRPRHSQRRSRACCRRSDKARWHTRPPKGDRAGPAHRAEPDSTARRHLRAPFRTAQRHRGHRYLPERAGCSGPCRPCNPWAKERRRQARRRSRRACGVPAARRCGARLHNAALEQAKRRSSPWARPGLHKAGARLKPWRVSCLEVRFASRQAAAAGAPPSPVRAPARGQGRSGRRVRRCHRPAPLRGARLRRDCQPGPCFLHCCPKSLRAAARGASSLLSPCIKVCAIDVTTGHVRRVCARTRAEIAGLERHERCRARPYHQPAAGATLPRRACKRMDELWGRGSHSSCS